MRWHDDFGEHGIERRRDVRALHDAAVDPYAIRILEKKYFAGGREVSAFGSLRAEPELDCMPI